jgi:hypothetical protein
MITFEDFTPGSLLGERGFLLDREAVAQWTALFPDDGESLPVMPAAMIAMVVMRAFVDILDERPRGNIHAAQTFWVRRLPCLGERLTTRLSCLGKEFKGNRRWVTLGSETNDAAGALLFRGRMTTIWAA